MTVKISNLKLSTRMAGAFSVLTLCLLIVGPLSVQQLLSAKKTIDDLYQNVIIPSAYTATGLMLNEKMRTAMRDAVRWNDPDMIEAKIQARKNFLMEFENNLGSFEATIKRVFLVTESSAFCSRSLLRKSDNWLILRPL